MQYPYSISDFSDSLQPHLLGIVTKGIVRFNGLKQHATVRELENLSRCEHPVLRATALRCLLDKNPKGAFEIISNHLDDTASVATDAGEFGIWYWTVTDDAIIQSSWIDEKAMNKTIEKVVLEHSYLRSAYTGLRALDTNTRYHSIIRTMCLQNREYDDIEHALSALARYQRKDDIAFIRDLLKENSWRLGNESFSLIIDFPDTAYLSILEKYVKRHLHRAVCTNWRYVDFKYLFEAIGQFKTQRSAKLLSEVLAGLSTYTCGFDTSSFHRNLKYAIWNNKCEAYAKLVSDVKPYILEDQYEQEKFRNSFPAIDIPSTMPEFTGTDTYRWPR